MNEPPIMLALLIAFVLGFGLCALCVVISGKRQASAREEQLAGELEMANRGLEQQYELQRMATAARPRSHS